MRLSFYYVSSFFIMILPSIIFLLLIRIFSKVLLIRFGQLPSDRIGHFSIDVELYLSKLEQTKLTKNVKDIFFIPNTKQICNSYLLKIWSKKLTIIRRFFIIPLWFLINSKYLKYFFKDHVLHHRIGKHFPHFDNENLILNSKQNINIEKNDIDECLEILKRNKIDINKKIVCLHVRDNLYLKKKYPLKDFSYHDYRDFELDHFQKLCEFFEKKGFLIFRMGNSTIKKLKFANKNIIDYSNSNFISDKMDIFLISKCSIFIGAESGLLSVARCFRKPLLNICGKPVVRSSYYNNLYCFKNLYRTSDNKPLTFTEIFSENLYDVHDKEILKAKGIYLKDLSSDEIFEYGQDIFNFYKSGCDISGAEKIKQKEFYLNFLENIKLFTYESKTEKDHNQKNLSYISPSFLRNNPTLSN